AHAARLRPEPVVSPRRRARLARRGRRGGAPARQSRGARRDRRSV
ncbi:MAG: hypothetical protein AVDCRST_MAG07-883, partial [uncultured Frankineae bacterium]